MSGCRADIDSPRPVDAIHQGGARSTIAIVDIKIVATPFKVVAACNVYGNAGRGGDDDVAVEVV